MSAGMDPTPVLSLDFGGTKLAAALVDISSGKVLAGKKELTNNRGARGSITRMFELGHELLRENGVSIPLRTGISFGGPVTLDRRSVLMSNHVADWEGIRLPELAEDQFGCPAFMDNDANLAALGSWIFDMDRQPDFMLYLQISTGIGSGIIAGRELYRGGSLAGEIGHATIIPGGPECLCGKHGCLESLSAGWALARAGRSVLSNARATDPIYLLSGGDLVRVDARLLLEAASQGDAAANSEVEKAFLALGYAISTLITLFDPQVVVLGGGVTRARQQIQSCILPVLQAELHPLFKDRYRLIFSKLDGAETILGAAYLDH